MAKKLKTLEEAQEEAELLEAALVEVEKVRIAEDIEKEHAVEVSAKQEREQLIAEAARLQGRVEGLNFISKVAVTSTFTALKNIKESKIYKDIPNIGTWENFCESIGYNRRYVDEQIENLSTLGNEFLAVTASFGIGYKDIRKLRSAAKDGTFAISSDAVIIEGEVIQLSDKDELKEALENLVAEQNRKLKVKDAEIATSQKQLDDARSALSRKDQIMEAHTQTINRLDADLKKTRTAKIYSDGTHLADDPIYQELLKLEHETEVLLVRYDKAARLEMSEFQQKMFGGVLMKFFKRLDDVREVLFAADDTHYFDNMFLTEDQKLMVENMMTPSKYMHDEK